MCPGSSISLTCTHKNVEAEQTRWETVKGARIISRSVALHGEDINNSQQFEPFGFTMISDCSGLTLTSIVQATANEALNGTMVLCRAGGLSADTEVGSVTVRVVGTLWLCVLSLLCVCVCG